MSSKESSPDNRLHVAVTFNKPELIDSLIAEGADVNARMTNPDEAVERIEEAAKIAVRKADLCQVPMPEYFEMKIEFVKHHMAYSKHFYPGATLKDDKTVCFESDNWYEMLRFCHFVLSDG